MLCLFSEAACKTSSDQWVTASSLIFGSPSDPKDERLPLLLVSVVFLSLPLWALSGLSSLEKLRSEANHPRFKFLISRPAPSDFQLFVLRVLDLWFSYVFLEFTFIVSYYMFCICFLLCPEAYLYLLTFLTFSHEFLRVHRVILIFSYFSSSLPYCFLLRTFSHIS